MGLVASASGCRPYDDMVRRHVIHPEAKAAGPDCKPSGPHTEGELGRLRVYVTDVIHIGKESHELEDVQAGLALAETTYVHYVNRRAQWERDKPILRTLPRKQLAKLSGLHLRSIKAILNTGRLPQPRNLKILHSIAERIRRQDPKLLGQLPEKIRWELENIVSRTPTRRVKRKA